MKPPAPHGSQGRKKKKKDTHLYAISVLRGSIGSPLIIISSLCFIPALGSIRFSGASSRGVLHLYGH